MTRHFDRLAGRCHTGEVRWRKSRVSLLTVVFGFLVVGARYGWTTAVILLACGVATPLIVLGYAKLWPRSRLTLWLEERGRRRIR